jgi:light-regulated signal transduction histidine kinase (bacteriophytochrome)
MSDSQTAAVDLTNCESEPIHRPGAIQPHGVLSELQTEDVFATDNWSRFSESSLLDNVAAGVMAVFLSASRRQQGVIASCTPAHFVTSGARHRSRN